ncbi:ribose 5-phosphate isomerase A-domain-containing protein [Gorgonomyces haynaldii]|nr:ribose 5-phosphate isomerase A-domain-containing protein [Gorgonomyces haynaldii]
MSLVEKAKKLASYAAIEQQVTRNDKVIGIGSGSTVVYAVERLGQLKDQLDIKACIPSSFQAEQLILENGLPLGSLNQYPEIDVSFDGADEVDPQFNCIKGGGACHLLEKLVIANSRRCYIVADHRKESQILGTAWTKGVPLEVIPSAYKTVQHKIKHLGGDPILRMAVNKAGPVVTDSGNFVIDAVFGQIQKPKELNTKLTNIVGVVETGLFCDMVHGVYLGMADGTVKQLKQ